MRKLSRITKNIYTNKLLDIIVDGQADEFKNIFLVLELAYSDLRKMITHKNSDYDEENIRFILYNILCGLNLLHSGGIVHRDIKPANILVNSDSSILLCDFGMARVIP